MKEIYREITVKSKPKGELDVNEKKRDVNVHGLYYVLPSLP